MYDDLTPSDEPTVLEELYRTEEKEIACREVARLFNAATPEEREVLQLIRNGLSTAEIAERLKITDSAVRMRMLHLRKRFNRREARGLAAEEVSEAVAPAPVVVASGPDPVPSAVSSAA
jgi:DNA-binding NarL/FixJ family response regulator